MDYKKAVRSAAAAIRGTTKKLHLAKADLEDIRKYIQQLGEEDKTRLALLQQNDMLKVAEHNLRVQRNMLLAECEHGRDKLARLENTNKKLQGIVQVQGEQIRKTNKFLWIMVAVIWLTNLGIFAQEYGWADKLLALL